MPGFNGAMPTVTRHRQASRFLKRRGFGGPRLAFVLGSGFRSVAEAVQGEFVVDFASIPGFHKPSVAGHGGQLLQGSLGGVPVLVLSGRVHYYEGHTFEDVTFSMRVLAELEVVSVVLTNAAGGIHRKLSPGGFMVIEDHINFMGGNPLRGPVAPGRERFLDLSACYDAGLSALLVQAARKERVALRRGVYLAVSGPSYETPAEIRMFERWGADAVGMSTVPEAIVARDCGMRVAGLSCITNLAAGRGGALSHQEVLEQSAASGGRAQRLLKRFTRLYAEHEKDKPGG